MNANPGFSLGYLRAAENPAGRRCDQKTLLERFLAQPDGRVLR
jgi:hypothetical protein